MRFAIFFGGAPCLRNGRQGDGTSSNKAALETGSFWPIILKESYQSFSSHTGWRREMHSHSRGPLFSFVVRVSHVPSRFASSLHEMNRIIAVSPDHILPPVSDWSVDIKSGFFNL